MNIKDCVKLGAAHTPAFYHSTVGGQKIDLYVFKASGPKERNKEAACPDPFSPEAFLNIEDNPRDFFFGSLLVNNEPCYDFAFSSGHLDESYDGPFLEINWHGKKQFAKMPKDLAARMSKDLNLDISSE
mgnify:CR=1 FL=1